MSRHQLAAIKTISERASKRLAKHGNQHGAALRGELIRLENAMRGLVSLHENRDPTETRERHIFLTAQSARRLAGEVVRIHDKIYESFNGYAKELAFKIEERSGVKEDKYAPEVRAAYRSLPDRDRLGFVNRLISAKDGPGIAALLQAPESLTGINGEMRGKFLNAYYAAVVPELLEEREDLSEAMDGIDVVVREVKGAAQQYQSAQELAKIEQDAEAAKEAQAHFEKTITGFAA